LTIELINIPEYWRNTRVRPRGFTELCDMVETQGKITGIWCWEQWNPKTGEVVKREITRNTVTDNGAIQIFQAAINNAVPSAVFNNIYINNNSGSSTLTTAFTNGQVVTTGANMAVAAIPAAIPLNNITPATGATTLTLGYGTGQTQTITMNAAATLGATALNIVGFTANAAYAIGQNVVPNPNVGENPTNTNLKVNQTGTVVEKYSGNLSAGAFTFTPTTGAGNRSVVVTFTFANSTNGGTTSNGGYSDAWLTNVSSAATTNNYVCHEINSIMTVNNSNNVTVTITLKI